jgi:hypothetical protein
MTEEKNKQIACFWQIENLAFGSLFESMYLTQKVFLWRIFRNRWKRPYCGKLGFDKFRRSENDKVYKRTIIWANGGI